MNNNCILSDLSEERYVGPDILKFICAFFVVCIHSNMTGAYVQYFISVTRAAVPIFFMITGFFYGRTQQRNREILQIKKILRLAVSGSIFFFIWEVFVYCLAGDLGAYLANCFSLRSVLGFIFLNYTPICGHLWYLFAILYVLVIVYFAKRRNLMKVLYILTPFLLIGDQLLGNYSKFLFGLVLPRRFVRNFLFVGIPYFCIGDLIYRFRDKIFSIPRLNTKCSVLSVLFCITAVLERLFLVSKNACSLRDQGMSILFLSVSLFILFISVYKKRTPSVWESFAADIGRKYSSSIYIIHPVFIRIVNFLMKRIGIFDIYIHFSAVIIFAVTTASVIIFEKLKRSSLLTKH